MPSTLLISPASPAYTKIFNLRSDPYERADTDANNYRTWWIHHAFLIVPAQSFVGREASELAYNIEAPRYPLLTAGAGIDKITEVDPSSNGLT